jgi:hypothetical protein
MMRVTTCSRDAIAVGLAAMVLAAACRTPSAQSGSVGIAAALPARGDEGAPLLQLGEIMLPLGGYFTAPAMDLHATDFTLATNVYLDPENASHRNIIFGNWGSQDNAWQMLFYVQGDGRPGVNLRRDMVTNGSDAQQDLVTLVGSTVVPGGAWHHVAVTFTWGADGRHPTCTLYVDGAAAGSTSPAVTAVPNLRNPYTLMPTRNRYWIGLKEDSLGHSDPDSLFAGQMRDFRVYSAALSPAAIARLIDE